MISYDKDAAVFEVSDMINVIACAEAWDRSEGRSAEQQQYFPDEPEVVMPIEALKTLKFYADLGHPVAQQYSVELVNN